jgi:prepilin-type N-terminal cleavage/methylation domain-containing protein
MGKIFPNLLKIWHMTCGIIKELKHYLVAKPIGVYRIVKATMIRGFSLIEMIIVIATLAIALTIGVPNFNRYIHNTNLKSAGRDLAGDIFNTKQTAAAQGVQYTIKFDKDANSYSIVNDASNQTTATKSPGSVAGYITIDSITYNSAQIGFQPRGTTSIGSVTLKNDIGSTTKITTSLMGKVSVDYTPQ